MFIRLKPGFKIERQREREKEQRGEAVLYLSEQTRSRYEVKLTGDGFSDQSGKLLDGNYLYVRTLDGKLYAAKCGEIGHHSYLSNGKKVTSVGHFIFQRGKLVLVSNESGHYTPTNEEMLSDVEFYFHLSENQDLIYEDHSSVPVAGKIYQYKANDFILAKGEVRDLVPLLTIIDTDRDANKRSAYGRKLKPIEQKKPEPENLTSNYLDDDAIDANHLVEIDCDVLKNSDKAVSSMRVVSELSEFTIFKSPRTESEPGLHDSASLINTARSTKYLNVV
jgi:hypothetical protein